AKGSKLRNKHKKTLRRIKKRQADRRRDFNHKLSRKIVDAYDIIIVEDINLNDMTCEIANINRTKNDLGFGQFRDFLSYKAENAGKIFIKVDPRGTTQECFKCGLWTKKELSDRIHKCPCGH